MALRVVFMGTPDFAVPSLRALNEASGMEVPLVLTRPDAVRGRGKKLVPSPVKACALECGLPVLETKRIGAEELDRIREARPDAIAVAAYGAILPDEVLSRDVARLGVVNVHGSLLPRWRGAAPIQRAILAGDERIGISIMRIAHELDAGPWCRQASVEAGEKGATTIMSELAELGARELVEALRQMDAGEDIWQEQDPELVTYAKKVEKAEMALSPSDGVRDNLLRVRAATDAAPARTSLSGRGLRVMEARQATQDDVATIAGGALAAGAVAVRRGRVLLGCADGALEPLAVKPDGKREMPAKAWASGLQGNDLSWGESA